VLSPIKTRFSGPAQHILLPMLLHTLAQYSAKDLVFSASCSEDDYMSENLSCMHYRTYVITLRTPHGYKARCLGCGADSQERGNAAAALVALHQQRHEELLRGLTPTGGLTRYPV
jgi:hypothetical protein